MLLAVSCLTENKPGRKKSIKQKLITGKTAVKPVKELYNVNVKSVRKFQINYKTRSPRKSNCGIAF